MIYLASPYSDECRDVEEWRFREVCRVAGLLMAEGHHVVSPIVHGHPVSQVVEMPTGFDFWMGWCLELLQRCDELWVLELPGWQNSVGVQAEMRYAQSIGMPVHGYRIEKAEEAERTNHGAGTDYEPGH